MAFAQAPIAKPGTEGFEVIVKSTGPVTAIYQGYNSSFYSNDLYLVSSDGKPANDKFLFNNKTSPFGSTAPLGSFTAGTKLLFRLHVRDTGKDYFTGAAGRNPDGHTHARAQAEWKPNETLVSFEDLFNGPFDYNDLSFSFTPTTAVQGIITNVASTKGWQTTSLKVTKGQDLSFLATGSWNVGYPGPNPLPYVGPDGYSPQVDSTIYQGCKLESILPYGVLLVRIGTDDPSFIAIGSKGEFPAYRDGFLEFRIHDADACLGDNAGQVTVTATLLPTPGATNPLQTILDFLGSIDFAKFLDLLSPARDILACALDAVVVVHGISTTGTVITTPDMAQDCAGAFHPIIDLLNKHTP